MRIAKCSYKSRVSWAIVEDNTAVLLKKSPFDGIVPSRTKLPLNSVRLEVPAQASKIVLIGLNYSDHAAELGMALPVEPVIFMKPASALIPAGAGIIYPAGVSRLDYEAELAVVIKKKAKDVSPENAGKYILGYTCLNDVTARDIQKKDGQWTRAKSFDTFCPVGPWVETSFDPEDKSVVCRLNGRTVQSSSFFNLIFSVNRIVSFVSSVMTLLPGDIVSTGTPPGVGPMKPGDEVEVEIEGIGILANRVKSRKNVKERK